MPGLLLQVPYTAVQFVALQQFRDWAARSGLSRSAWSHSVSFASGAFAGAAATVASYPFDLLRTTLAAQGEPKVTLPFGLLALFCAYIVCQLRQLSSSIRERVMKYQTTPVHQLSVVVRASSTVRQL